MRRLKRFRPFFFVVLPVCILSIGLFLWVENATSAQQNSDTSTSEIPRQVTESSEVIDNVLQTAVVPWDISHSSLISPDIIQTIETELNNPYGWLKAGVTFEKSDFQRTEKHLIIFNLYSSRWYEWHKIVGCKDPLSLGCVERSDGRSWTKRNPIQLRSVLKGGGPCVIWLNKKIFSDEAVIRTINHEIGHCLGLRHHGKNSVMSMTEVFYPSDRDINVVKEIITK